MYAMDAQAVKITKNKLFWGTAFDVCFKSRYKSYRNGWVNMYYKQNINKIINSIIYDIWCTVVDTGLK